MEKHFESAILRNINGRRLSRKQKRAFYCFRMNRSRIYRLFLRLKFKHLPKNIFQTHVFSGVEDLFCPQCGCIETKFVDHEVPDPEIWVEIFCARCGYQVGAADNSPYSHALQWLKEDNPKSKAEFEGCVKTLKW